MTRNKSVSVSTEDRKEAGFTMMEMLIAVAILVILMAVGFIALQSHQRSMKQLELDQTAREIFIAAQNHLSMAQSQGYLADVSSTDAGYNPKFEAGSKENPLVDEEGNPITDSNTTLYYWFVSPDDGQPRRDTVLYQMLPYNSIDETIRTHKSYVIEYDLETGRVLSVFYSDQSNLSDYQFSESDFNQLFNNYYGENKKSNRLSGYGNGIIGWYGGEDLGNRSSTKLYAPSILIENAEKLTVSLDFSRLTNAQRTQDLSVRGAVVKLYIYGDTSNKLQCFKTLTLSDEIARATPTQFVLDDITTSGKHFVQLFCNSAYDCNNQPYIDPSIEPMSGSLIPGENITVYAEVSSNEVLARSARSPRRHANSLFDNITMNSSDENEILISNIRHLENLNRAISGYDYDALKKLDDDNNPILDESGNVISDGSMCARQVADLQWIGDAGTSGSRVFCKEINPRSPNSVQIYYFNDDNVETAYSAGFFYPITLPKNTEDESFTYNGDSHKITQLKCQSEDSAGMVASMHDGSTIKNLDLVDCSAISTGEGGSAGILAGSISANGLTIQNVLVRDSGGSTTTTVKANGKAGGLIGCLDGESGGQKNTVDGCVAAVFVNATGENAIAGGLLGGIEGSAEIKGSYAAGHTEKGQYNPGSYNVIADGSGGIAGGLVGKAEGALTVSSCYSTCSATAKNDTAGYAGGLIGDVEADGTIKNCYATGLISGKTQGAFIGKLESSMSLDVENHYLDFSNNGMKAIGEGAISEEDAPVAFDKDVDSYETFCTRSGKAEPYDDELTKLYKDAYTYKTVSDLGASVSDSFYVKAHYGDWPSPELLVINTPSNGS